MKDLYDGPFMHAATRRKVIGRFVALSAAAFGALASRSMGTDVANAGTLAWCCDLATSIPCAGSGPNFTCPAGYTKHVWYCCEFGRIAGCGECTQGPDCWTGPFACSEDWTSQIPC